MHGRAGTVFDYEESRRFRCDLDLFVIVGVAKFLAPREQCAIDISCLLRGVDEHRLGDLVQLRVGRIEQNDSVLGEQSGKKRSKGLAVIDSGTIALGEQIADPAFAEELLSTLNEAIDLVAKLNLFDGGRSSSA